MATTKPQRAPYWLAAAHAAPCILSPLTGMFLDGIAAWRTHAGGTPKNLQVFGLGVEKKLKVHRK